MTREDQIDAMLDALLYVHGSATVHEAHDLVLALEREGVRLIAGPARSTPTTTEKGDDHA